MAMLLGIAEAAMAGVINDNGGGNIVPPQTGLPIRLFTGSQTVNYTSELGLAVLAASNEILA